MCAKISIDSSLHNSKTLQSETLIECLFLLTTHIYFLSWHWEVFHNTQCSQFFTSKIAKLCQKNGLWKRLTCAVDYVEIISEDPRITTLHASKFHTMFLHNKLPEFDAIISYSSLEHSGLGRYRNIL